MKGETSKVSDKQGWREVQHSMKNYSGKEFQQFQNNVYDLLFIHLSPSAAHNTIRGP